MKMNFNKLMFNSMMTMGVIISLTSNNWISMWLGMEISMMSFIPMMKSKMKMSSESCMKYFIVQSLSSSIMMMGIIMISLSLNYKMILLTSIFMKLGMVPFHNWMLSMIEGISYLNTFNLFTLMKMAPMNMLSYLNMNFQMIIILSLILSSISGLNQNSIKKVITYSSIYNMSLILISINSWINWLTYMYLYTLSMILIMKMCNNLNLNFINQTYINNNNLTMKIMLWLIMISISGMPPMLTFMTKMIIMEEMIMKNQLFLILIMMMTSTITTYFYMRLSSLTMMFYTSMPKWKLFKKKNINMNYFLIMIFLYPMVCLLKSFY